MKDLRLGYSIYATDFRFTTLSTRPIVTIADNFRHPATLKSGFSPAGQTGMKGGFGWPHPSRQSHERPGLQIISCFRRTLVL